MIAVIRCWAVAAILAVASTATAVEFSRESLDRVMGVCRSDYHRVCDEVVPGDGRVWRCLLRHERQLTPQCLAALKLAYAVEACAGDYERYCRGARKGLESVRCLSQRLPDLAPECRRVIDANAGGEERGPYTAQQVPDAPPYSRPYAQPYPPQTPGYEYRGVAPGEDQGGNYDERYADGAPGPYSGQGEDPYPQPPRHGPSDPAQNYYGGPDSPQGYYGGGRPFYAPPASDEGR